MNTHAENQTHYADHAAIETVKTVSKSSLKTFDTVTDWRRANAATDPSLIFGSLVFAQVVAGDLSRPVAENVVAMVDGMEEAGDESLADSIAAPDTSGLFGAVAPVSGLVPVAGGVAAIAGLPSSGSDLPRSSQTGASASDAPVSAQDPASSNNDSFIFRNLQSARDGGQPSADGATEARPSQEAAGAQAAAADAGQFAGGGADPFSAGIVQTPVDQGPDTTVMGSDGPTSNSWSGQMSDSMRSADSGDTFGSDARPTDDGMMSSGRDVRPVSTASDPRFSADQSPPLAG